MRTFFFNIFLSLCLIILFESIFGYWFKDDNFGIHVRKLRNIEKKFDNTHNGKKYSYTFKRNFHGFIGEEIKPEEIKIVFEGGSTGEQLFLPPELRVL